MNALIDEPEEFKKTFKGGCFGTELNYEETMHLIDKLGLNMRHRIALRSRCPKCGRELLDRIEQKEWLCHECLASYQDLCDRINKKNAIAPANFWEYYI